MLPMASSRNVNLFLLNCTFLILCEKGLAILKFCVVTVNYDHHPKMPDS